MAVGLNTGTPQTQLNGASLEQATKLAGADSEKLKAVVSKALEVLAGANVKVTRQDSTGTDGAAEKKTTGATSTPALDNPDDAKAREANLEKLIAYLQLDNEERQAEMARDRIATNKDSFAKEHEHRTEKINKSIADMDKAEKSRKASSIFGWIMAAIAVIVAVVACVATGGLAVGPVVGALVAVGLQIANEAGVMDEVTEALSDFLVDKCGMSKSAAQIVAAIAITVAIIALSAGSGWAAGKVAVSSGLQATLSHAISASVQNAAEIASKVATAVSRVVQLGSVTAGCVAAYTGYKAGMSSADASETARFVAALKQRMEESQEELEAILELIQSNISQVANLIDSATDTSNEIARNIGSMA